PGVARAGSVSLAERQAVPAVMLRRPSGPPAAWVAGPPGVKAGGAGGARGAGARAPGGAGGAPGGGGGGPGGGGSRRGGGGGPGAIRGLHARARSRPEEAAPGRSVRARRPRAVAPADARGTRAGAARPLAAG